MANTKIEIDPKEVEAHDRYKLLIGSIVPRPIGFVSTINSSGVCNLAPFSFFNGVCSNPMSVLFCPVVRSTDGKEKDTLLNIKANKEFVINIVSEEFADAMNQCSAEYPPDISEFTESKLTPEPSKIVKPPLVKESKVNLECKLFQIVKIGEGKGSGCVVIGEVVYAHIKEDVYENGRILLSKLKPIGRLGGTEYCRVTDTFNIQRPNIAAPTREKNKK